MNGWIVLGLMASICVVILIGYILLRIGGYGKRK